jgi:hypothetical protein
MRKTALPPTLVVLGILVVAVASAGASAPTGTLNLSHAVLTGNVNQVACPPGNDPSTACFQTSGAGVVRGLGLVSEQYLLFVQDADSSCERWNSTPVLTVKGKGEIDLSVHQSGQCVVPTTGALNGSLVYTVTGGSGIYAGASGSGSLVTRGGPGTTGRNVDTLGGSLTVYGLVFDLTPPVLTGAVSKVVLAPRGASSARVRFSVTARDPGHGTVPVTCKPHAGSRFKLGRTRVVCSATDSSGNKATARFTITVKRR